MQEKEKEKDKREEDRVREVTWIKACLAEFKEDLNCKTKTDQKKKKSQRRKSNNLKGNIAAKKILKP